MNTKLPYTNLLILVLIIFFTNRDELKAQRTCGTVYVDSVLRANNPNIETHKEFETWMAQKIHEYKQNEIVSKTSAIYTVPVIFHIIHNGEEVGSETNLSQAAINSQIEVLNQDFRKMEGTNGWNDHPDGADTEIEFCLATIDEDGNELSEPGIHRIDQNDEGWQAGPYDPSYIDGTIKPATGWNPDNYMNIWICDLGAGLLGYATFPTGSTLPDNVEGSDPIIDGVVLLYQSIGAAPANPFPIAYNLGRTATHEIGHWFGLRHTWGNGPCGVDDYCDDTPESDAANGGCATGHESCGSIDMVENYMDYSDDICFNIFTNDQKYRMRTVLENSPRRASLLNSNVCGNVSASPNCDFTLSSNVVLEGEQVDISDNTTNNPTSWSWTFSGGSPSSSTAQNPNNIIFWNEGTYTITLNASNEFGSCTTSESINVLPDSTNGCASLGLELNSVPPSCNQTNGVITAEAIGGNGPYNFNWSNGSELEYLINIAPGNYTVTVTDNNNCQFQETVALGENTPSINPFTVDPSCSGACDGSASALISGGMSPYTYDWNNGSGSSSQNGLCDGQYSVTVTDASGCMDSAFFELVSEVNINFSSSSTNSTCLENNGSASISATGGNSPYSYQWSSGHTAANVNNIVGDTYMVTVMDANGCFEIDSVVIGNIGADGIEINSASVCIGASATLSATGGLTYEWSTGSTNNSITVSVDNDTVYYITVTDSYNCTVTEPVTVTLNNVPQTSLSSSAVGSICAGSSITLTASGGETYLWSHDSEIEASTAVVNPFSSTPYSVQAYNGGCGGNTSSINVNVISPAPLADAQVNDDVVLLNSDGEIDVNFLQGSSLGEVYEWDFDGNGSFDYTGSTPITTHTYTTVGSYDVVLNVTLNGCSLTDTVIIDVLKGSLSNFTASFNSQIAIYPNPNNGSFTIELLEAYGNNNISIYNPVGQIIYTNAIRVQSNSHQEIIELNNFSNGVYYIIVSNKHNTVREKLILRK